MEITVERVEGNRPVTILGIHGHLDASSYQDLIANARELHHGGARYLILDMSDTDFMSSAGLVALHSIAILMRGEEPPDPESGWEAFHAIGRDLESGSQSHVKLLNPHSRVDKVLQKTGFKKYFEIYTDREQAIASF